MTEFRICWNASSNISFKGATEWEEWDAVDWGTEDVEEGLTQGNNGTHVSLPEGLQMAIEACGFEWWVETRDA